MSNLRFRNIDRGLVRLWLVLLVASAGSLVDVAEFASRKPDSSLALVGIAFFAIFKASALTAIYAACRKNRWLRIPAVIMIVAFIVLSIINGGCFLFYGFGFSMKLFTIFAETNLSEVGEFMPELGAKLLSMFASPWFWAGIGAFVAAWIWLPRISGKWLSLSILSLSFAGLVYFIMAVVPAEFGRMNHSMFGRTAQCVVKYCGDRNRIRELEIMKRPLPFPETLTSRRASERIVVVIGESASRDHLSLYGYPLPTTPRLDSIRDELYIFNNAVASSTSTAQNMPRLLSFMTDEPGELEWYEYPSLLQVFHRLGYRIYWLSNQGYAGKWSNLSSILSADADVMRYVGSLDSEDYYLTRYDEALLSEWDKTLAAGDSLQLTFIHLMGSHFQYANRYPKSRRRFTGDDIMSKMPRKWLNNKKAGIVAEYDNSILYTDSILSVIIDGIKRENIPTLLVYVSDHGENVYDDRDYRGRDSKFVKVPFVIFANGAYKERNPDIIAALENGSSHTFSTSELPQIVLHASGTSYEMYDSIRDPLARGFIPRKIYVDEEEYLCPNSN